MKGESLGQLQGGFRDSELAAKLVYSQTQVLAVPQRPLATVAFDEPATAAARKTKPSWSIVAKDDNTINPDVERFGYQRAGLRKVIELDSSRLAMLTHPNEVAALIERRRSGAQGAINRAGDLLARAGSNRATEGSAPALRRRR
jgi:hypothetical protein